MTAGRMRDPTAIDWPTCDEDGCIGVCLAAIAKCLAHAGDEQRNATLKQIGETGEIDARGVPITQALLEQVLAAAPHDEGFHPTLTIARFDWATFQGDARFNSVAFQQHSSFFKATFQTTTVFAGVAFQAGAEFSETTFHGLAAFYHTIFQSKHSSAMFRKATFKGDAVFRTVAFEGDAWFDDATFQGDAMFEEATFQGGAAFHDATFQDYAGFGGMTFQGYAGFDGATFEKEQKVGPLLAYRGLGLDEVQFAQPAQIEASTIWVHCRRAQFVGGVQLRLRWAWVLLDDADLAAPSIVIGIPSLTDEYLAEREQRIAKEWQRPPGGAVFEQPRLLSLRRANSPDSS
jgi:Pentapeptide repeats (9 copies)